MPVENMRDAMAIAKEVVAEHEIDVQRYPTIKRDNGDWLIVARTGDDEEVEIRIDSETEEATVGDDEAEQPDESDETA